MQINKLLVAGILFAGCMASSCIDDKYDLSDIDTTVRVEVRDLVIPVNIDDVTLGDIIKIHPGDRVQIINGVYAVSENGSFSSDNIEIKAVHMSAPSIPSTSNSITIPAGGQSFGSLPDSELKLNFSTNPTSFSTSDMAVTSSIISVKSIGAHFDITMTLKLGGFENLLKSFRLTDFTMQLPKGLTMTTSAGSYKPETGIFYAQSLSGTGNTLSLTFSVTSIAEGDALTFETVDGANKLTFSDEMSIKSATLELTAADLTSGASTVLPSTLNLDVHYNMSAIDVTDFSGKIHFLLDVANISDIDLSNLPDALSQKGTNLRLANPQIYLSVNNPVAKYGTYATTGVEIVANRPEQQSRPYGLDAPGYFIIPGLKTQSEYSFCLSPTEPTPMIDGFAGATHVGYKELSDVLSGNTMPKSLSISLVEPQLPEQPVENFVLGENLGKVEGHYTFFAPLALDDNSEITYSDTKDGWSDDDLDKMTISVLAVSTEVTSTLPLGVELTGYPVDKQGNRIGDVEIVGAHIPAGATSQAVTITTTGSITNLDGICFTAHVTAGSTKDALAPGQGLQLKNIRVKVSGYYEDEL